MRSALLIAALMMITPLTAFAALYSAQDQPAAPLNIASEPPIGFESSHVGCGGDQALGGCHLATGEWWQRGTYDVTVQDSDGDGIPNSQDRFPHDSAMPASTTAQPRLSCSPDVRFPCIDTVGARLFGSAKLPSFHGLQYPFGSAWVDIDNDGDLDLSINDAFGIKIFFNENGGLSDSPDIAFSTPNGKAVMSQAWADVDRDGDLDVMLGTFPEIDWGLVSVVPGSSGANELYINDGGTFSGPAWSATDSGNYTQAVSWGDVDGDGWMDVAFGNAIWFDDENVNMSDWDANDRIYLNDGAGNLETTADWVSAAELVTSGLVLADIDGDGDVDMLTTSEQHRTNGVFLGGDVMYYENNNGFSAQPTWSNSSNIVAASRNAPALADWDGDGDLDLALATEVKGIHHDRQNHTKVLDFDGSGFNETPSWISSANDEAGAIHWVDYDSDGDYDLLTVTDSDDPAFCLVLNLGTELEELMMDLSTSQCIIGGGAVGGVNNVDVLAAEHISSGDFDGDGDLDTLLLSMNGVELWVNSAQALVAGSSSSLALAGVTMAYTDANGDPVVAIPQTPGLDKWALGDITSVEFTNLDHYTSLEGDIEVIVSHRADPHPAGSSGTIIQDDSTYYRSYGNQDWTTHPIDLNSSLDAIAVADLDNDGDMDILGGNDRLFATYLREDTCINNCANVLEFREVNWNVSDSPSGQFDNRVYDIALGDVNGDGYLDAAFSFQSSGGGGGGGSPQAFCIYINQQNGSFDSTPSFCSPEGEEGAGLAWNDYDADGDLDLAIGVVLPNSAVIVYRNDGGGQMSRTELDHPSCAATCSIWAVDWKDIDQDGDDDLVVGPNMNRIAVFYNVNGVLSAQNAASTSMITDVRGFSWADMDGDGWEDLLVAVRDGEDLIFNNLGGSLSDQPSFRSGITSTTYGISAFDHAPEYGGPTGGLNLFGYSVTEVWVLSTQRDNDMDYLQDPPLDLEDPSGYDDFFPFDPTQAEDEDGDGYGDDSRGMLPDSCVNMYGESWRDRWGCTDEDGDGQSNLYDDFWIKDTQWTDSDGDGLGDNWADPSWTADREDYWPGEYIPNAYNPDENPLDFDNDGFENANLFPFGTAGDFDHCPQLYGTSSEDRFGCQDLDSDGWSDMADRFPGDGSQWNDTDMDGFGDNPFGNMPDACPDEHGNSSRDVFGCIDMDGDGWSALSDFDDADGWEWSDLDGDGYGDNRDECVYDAGDVADFEDIGCPDTDGDGVADRSDAFPNLIWHWEDADEDGIGDNQNAPNGMYDSCPDEAGTSHRLDVRGCPDTDSDGLADEIDDCPDVPGLSMIAARGCPDSDGDGLPDEFDLYPGPHGGTAEDYDGDGVPNFQDDFEYDRTQSLDTDGDGRGDNISQGATDPDLFPNQAGAWADSDNDGWTDQLNNDFTDDCPSIPGNSEIPWRGCPDIDGDGIMDLADEDADGDGISNTLELQAGGAEAIPYDIYDPDSRPPDLDGDGMPDSLDADTDGDGFPDELEEDRGSDPSDANVTPLNMYGSESGLYYVPGEGFSSQYSSDGIELSASWAVALATSEYLGMLLLLPLSIVVLMRKSLRYKKVKRRLETLDEPGELDDFEEEIDELIGKGKVKVEHGLLLRNLFERTRDELAFSSTEQQLADRPSYERQGHPPERGERMPEQRPKRGPPPGQQGEEY